MYRSFQCELYKQSPFELVGCGADKNVGSALASLFKHESILIPNDLIVINTSMVLKGQDKVYKKHCKPAQYTHMWAILKWTAGLYLIQLTLHASRVRITHTHDPVLHVKQSTLTCATITF